MAIPDEDIAKVRAATDIAGLIGEHTSLKRVGRRLVGLCPFHSEKSPSFSVNAEEGFYHCFGCQASGDAISFVRAVEGCDFVDAVERLAARAGVSIRNDADPASEANRSKRQRLLEALDAAAEFYHRRLLEHPDAGRARQYLRGRGYDGETVRQFKIGYATTGYDELLRAVRFPSETLLDAGLAFNRRGGGLVDAFRERIIFPIFDPGNRVIAMGGRVMPEELRRANGDPGPKYRNSPESAVYQKRATLYGLNWAKTEIATSREVIVCEGYTDVIGLFSAGLRRAVATCGTALTEEHFRLLSRFAQRVVLCFDADAAGEHAAARLYEWERRHELELAVALLPKGSDPAELARTDPDALRRAVGGARPFLGFRIDQALDRFDLTLPEGRARAAEAAIAAIAEHPNDLVRDQYLVEVTDRTHHDPARLRALLEQTRANPPPPPAERETNRERDRPPPEDAPGDAPPFDGPEPPNRRPAGPEQRAGRDALLLAIHRPELIAGRFTERLFADPLQRSAFVALCSSNALHEAVDNAEPAVAELLRRMAVSGDTESIDADGTFIELVRIAVTAALGELDATTRLASAGGEPEVLAALSTRIRWVKSELELLRDPLVLPGHVSPAIEAAERLLAWLSSADQEG